MKYFISGIIALLIGIFGLKKLQANTEIDTTNAPIGIKNNNPGNIEKTPASLKLFKDFNLCTIQAGGRYLQFNTPEDGISAIGYLLILYQFEHGIDTIYKDVSRYAPLDDPSNDDFNGYCSVLSEYTGKGINETFSFIDNLTGLIQGHVIAENGYSDNKNKIGWYSNYMYSPAAILALNYYHSTVRVS